MHALPLVSLYSPQDAMCDTSTGYRMIVLMYNEVTAMIVLVALV